MPLIDRNGAPVEDPATVNMGIPYGVRDDDSEGETPSLGQTAVANFRLNSWWASALQSQRGMFPEEQFDPSFDPWARIQGTELEPFWERFADSRNARDFEDIRADIESENHARDVLSRSSTLANIATGLGVGIADPTILLPGAIAVRGPGLGFSTLKTALMTGALNMGIAGTEEAFLHASQQTRTLDETAWNVLGSGVLGSILGAGFAKAMNRAEFNRLSTQIMDDMAAGPGSNPDLDAVDSAVVAMRQMQAGSAGAAAVPTPQLDELGVSNAIAKGVLAAAPFTPVARALRWKSAQARSTFFRLAENSVYLTGTEKGKATTQAVENFIHQWDGRYDLAMEQHLQAWRDHRKSGGKLSRAEFGKAVSLAARRADTSSVPEVSRAAKAWRSQVIEPGTKAGQAAGLYPDDLHVNTAQSYFTRVYDRKLMTAEEFKIVDGKPGFKPTVKEYFRPLADKAKFVSDADFESYLDDIANNVFDKITGRGGNLGEEFQRITVAARGPLKERTFNVPDALIERWLDNDVERVMAKFSRTLGADVEIANAFPESVDLGTKRVTLQGPLQKIREEYLKLREAAAGDAKALAALAKEERSAIEDIEAMRDMLRGTYTAPLDARYPSFARVSRIATTFNYIRSGGGFAVSSLTDVARPMMTAGTFSHYAAGLAKFATNPHFRAIARQEAKRAGTVGDTAKYARLASMTEIMDPYAQGTAFERYAVNSNRLMTRASGIALWNDWAKTFSAALTESRLVKNIMGDWDKLHERERRYMTYVGIDKDMAEEMRFQIGSASQAAPNDAGKVGDFWHSGTDTWGNETLKRTFWAAIDKDVRSTIVTPGVGDLPLFAHTAAGKNLLQYKSFVIASHQKALVRAVQEGANGSQVAVLMGIMGAVSVGMFLTFLKAVEGNRVEELSDNPGAWLAEGVDRSGMLSILMEASATSELARGPGLDKYPAGIYTGLQALFPDADQTSGPSRFATRGVLGQLLGPSAGTIEDTARIWGWTMNPERRPAGIKAALTLLPGRSLPYVRPILEYGIRPRLDEGQQ